MARHYSFTHQLVEIKYSLLKKRKMKEEVNEDEYRRLKRYMRDIVNDYKEVQHLPNGDYVELIPVKFYPTIKLRTKSFILEHFPGYAKRLI